MDAAVEMHALPCQVLWNCAIFPYFTDFCASGFCSDSSCQNDNISEDLPSWKVMAHLKCIYWLFCFQNYLHSIFWLKNKGGRISLVPFLWSCSSFLLCPALIFQVTRLFKIRSHALFAADFISSVPGSFATQASINHLVRLRTGELIGLWGMSRMDGWMRFLHLCKGADKKMMLESPIRTLTGGILLGWCFVKTCIHW